MTVDRVNGSFTTTAVMSGIWFRGPVRIETGALTMFLIIEACRLDSGLTQVGAETDGAGTINVQACLIFGNVTIRYNAANLTMNSVIGGGISVKSLGYHTIIGNYIQGAPGVGIFSANPGYPGYVADNTVVDCTTGLSSNTGGSFLGNTVVHCSADGVLDGRIDHGLVLSLSNNRITDSGGYGMNVGDPSGTTSVSGNRIERSGADGIHFRNGFNSASGNVVIDAGHDGISEDSHEQFIIEGNRVYHAAADGIRVNGGGFLNGNIVGRCGGNGISFTKPRERIHHNTSYRNQGSGFFLVNSYEGLEIDHNIGYGNGRHGIDGLAMIALSCNDWFANSLAPLSWPTEADLQLDPLFCNVETDSVGLTPESPLIAAKGCDLVGALGAACSEGAEPIATHDKSESALSVRLWPSSRVEIELVDDSPAQLEVFDIQGRIVTSRELRGLSAGSRELNLDLSVRPGVYFARLKQSGRIATSKGVVLLTR
jgi:hypothetical protein